MARFTGKLHMMLAADPQLNVGSPWDPTQLDKKRKQQPGAAAINTWGDMFLFKYQARCGLNATVGLSRGRGWLPRKYRVLGQGLTSPVNTAHAGAAAKQLSHHLMLFCRCNIACTCLLNLLAWPCLKLVVAFLTGMSAVLCLGDPLSQPLTCPPAPALGPGCLPWKTAPRCSPSTPCRSATSLTWCSRWSTRPTSRSCGASGSCSRWLMKLQMH